MSILGTFLTRSGVLASVHSFTQSSVGPVFLAFFGVALVVSLALLLARSRELAAPGALESSICRETAFLLNNLLLVAITFTILVGTLFPLLVEATQGSQLSVGAPYFDHVAVPIGFALLFLMGIGPALPWGATRLEEIQYRLLGPVIAGVGTILLLLLIGVRGVGALVTFGGGAFVLAVTVARVYADVRARRANTREGGLRAGGHLLRANPRRYGGYLAHVGVLLILIGIAASQSYQVQAIATLRPNQSMRLDGYTVKYLGWRPKPQSDRMVIQADVQAWHGTQRLGTLLPSQNIYASLPTPVVTPAVREEPLDMLTGLFLGRNPLPDLDQLVHGNNPFEDVYIVLDAVNNKSSAPATLQVFINPMVGLIWIGGIVLGLGGLLALAPTRKRRRIMVTRKIAAPKTEELRPEEAAV